MQREKQWSYELPLDLGEKFREQTARLRMSEEAAMGKALELLSKWNVDEPG
ncbi:MAG: hypothetical protein V4480_00815 [Patescibacteria group bacterium]